MIKLGRDARDHALPLMRPDEIAKGDMGETYLRRTAFEIVANQFLSLIRAECLFLSMSLATRASR
jgi:hypothetical protein